MSVALECLTGKPCVIVSIVADEVVGEEGATHYPYTLLTGPNSSDTAPATVAKRNPGEDGSGFRALRLWF